MRTDEAELLRGGVGMDETVYDCGTCKHEDIDINICDVDCRCVCCNCSPTKDSGGNWQPKEA
jgi:hypothetical protein